MDIENKLYACSADCPKANRGAHFEKLFSTAFKIFVAFK
jgi:hypothetical protein